MTTLEFSHVSKVYNVRGAGQLKAIDDVSFTLNSGQTIGLVGQSGSGKSTIAKILTQLETPTTGEVLLDGKPIPRRGRGLRRYRQQLRMVFQDPFASLNPYHSIRYHLERPIRLDDVVPKKDTEAEVRRLLERVGRLDGELGFDGGHRVPPESPGADAKWLSGSGDAARSSCVYGFWGRRITSSAVPLSTTLPWLSTRISSLKWRAVARSWVM